MVRDRYNWMRNKKQQMHKARFIFIQQRRGWLQIFSLIKCQKSIKQTKVSALWNFPSDCKEADGSSSTSVSSLSLSFSLSSSSALLFNGGWKTAPRRIFPASWWVGVWIRRVIIDIRSRHMTARTVTRNLLFQKHNQQMNHEWNNWCFQLIRPLCRDTKCENHTGAGAVIKLLIMFREGDHWCPASRPNSYNIPLSSFLYLLWSFIPHISWLNTQWSSLNVTYSTSPSHTRTDSFVFAD